MGKYDNIGGIESMNDDIPNTSGMNVLCNVVDLETGTRGNVVIRSITENFWLNVIEATKTHRVCALGTPGIGKTTTTCILIRLLLAQKKTVVYLIRGINRNGFVYMFTPTLEASLEVDVKVIEEMNFKYSDANVDKESIFYVVDPGQTKDNCNLPVKFKGKVIIVASPDNGHWGSSDFLKLRDTVKGSFMFMPVWTLNELLNAKHFMDNSLSDDTIVSRFERVGGVPRHIFADDVTFAGILRAQESALNSLREDQLRKLTSNDMNSVQTFEGGEPKSLLMVYESSSESNFQDFTVTVASKLVISKLVEKYAMFMWNLMVSLSAQQGGLGWKIFETICHERMLGEPKVYFDIKYHNGTKLEEVQNGTLLTLGGCRAMKGTLVNLITAARREEHTLFYSLNPTYPLFDSMYRVGSTFYAFQITLGKTHSCIEKYLLRFAAEARGPSNFLLHYLTYEGNYGDFALKEASYLRDLLKDKMWSINAVRIPRSDDDHMGPSKKFKRKEDSTTT